MADPSSRIRRVFKAEPSNLLSKTRPEPSPDSRSRSPRSSHDSQVIGLTVPLA